MYWFIYSQFPYSCLGIWSSSKSKGDKHHQNSLLECSSGKLVNMWYLWNHTFFVFVFEMLGGKMLKECIVQNSLCILHCFVQKNWVNLSSIAGLTVELVGCWGVPDECQHLVYLVNSVYDWTVISLLRFCCFLVMACQKASWSYKVHNFFFLKSLYWA